VLEGGGRRMDHVIVAMTLFPSQPPSSIVIHSDPHTIPMDYE